MPEPRVCASIASPTFDGVLRSIALLEPYKPDLVEVRLDYMKKIEGLDMVREVSPYPLIATCRRAIQGGLFRGSERMRLRILREACEEGFEYVDMELSTPGVEEAFEEFRGMGVSTIASHHYLEGTPSFRNMMRMLERGLRLKPDIMKIVGTARRYEDNYEYLSLVLKKGGLNLVSFGMGRLGIPSRILSPLLGGFFTYASAEEGSESAPGQISIATLREIYRLLGVRDG